MNKEYIVLSRQDAIARNNSPYVNLKIANQEGNESVCVFDVPKTSGPKWVSSSLSSPYARIKARSQLPVWT